MISRRGLAALLLFSLCASATAQVTRAEAMATAEAYLNLRWVPSEANIFHGTDAEGIHVETPDRGFARQGTRPGWWTPTRENIGMPYMWGGFSTPAEFQTGLKRGLYAGDVYSLEKRRLGDSAVSKHAIGIDCSGLISRCWKLPRAYSTKELPSLCAPLGSFQDLKAGDILNTPDKHVLLFKAFDPADPRRILEYEAGSPPSWKVLLNSAPIAWLQAEGYQPLRYRQIRD